MKQLNIFLILLKFTLGWLNKTSYYSFDEHTWTEYNNPVSGFDTTKGFKYYDFVSASN